MTETKFCENCKKTNTTHEYQDKTYGKFTRIMNKKESGGFVCTICGDGGKKK